MRIISWSFDQCVGSSDVTNGACQQLFGPKGWRHRGYTMPVPGISASVRTPGLPKAYRPRDLQIDMLKIAVSIPEVQV